jgi:hypothetical protein
MGIVPRLSLRTLVCNGRRRLRVHPVPSIPTPPPNDRLPQEMPVVWAQDKPQSTHCNGMALELCFP